MDPPQKSQARITVCAFVAGGASGAARGLQPQQVPALFALEVVFSQVTVKAADD